MDQRTIRSLKAHCWEKKFFRKLIRAFDKNVSLPKYLILDAMNMFILTETIVKSVCYHVTYAFQNKSTLYSCLNVKEIQAQNRRDIQRQHSSNI